jgi:uncharacterized protein (UPF0332 family)
MIDDNDRKSLVEYRYQQAFETYELAKFLFENNKLTLAVNRTKSDYDAFVEFSTEEVEELLSEMYEFILKIKSLL